jgi:phosphatidylinositol alpha-1,6-mannosyltransferase
MKLAIATEQRFFRDRTGSIHTDSAFGSYDFWKRYGEVFESVLVIARVSRQPARLSAPAEGPGVKIHPLTDYLGVDQYLLRRESLKEEIALACHKSDALIARLPGAIGDLAIRQFKRASRPYAAYVVGDPAGLLSREVVRHPLQPFIRWRLTKSLQRWCKEADCVAYVTKTSLQQLYPPCSQFVTSYSDVDLPNEAFASSPRSDLPSTPPHIISVAMFTRYKGIDVLMEAVALLARKGFPCYLELVGSGTLRSTLERKATQLGIRNLVHFTGQLPNASAVRERLDAADLFVLPSLTEGLPRALLEAMARALPCIATSVGGVVELLSPLDLVPPGSPRALADKILDVSNDQQRLAQMSARNLETAAEYSMEVTKVRRREFCSRLAHSATLAGT